jgi:hypothetical protein
MRHKTSGFTTLVVSAILACGLGFLAMGDSARADALGTLTCEGNWGAEGTHLGVVCNVTDTGGIGTKTVHGNTRFGHGLTATLHYGVASSTLNGVIQNPATGQILSAVRCCPQGAGNCGAAWTLSPASWTARGGFKNVANPCGPTKLMDRTRCKAATWCD